MSNSKNKYYHNDHRTIATVWWDKIDEKQMLVTDLKGFIVPFRYGVCVTCHGKGTCPNSSINTKGLTTEDSCSNCNGKRVIPIPLNKNWIMKEMIQIKKDKKSKLRLKEIAYSKRACGIKNPNKPSR